MHMHDHPLDALAHALDELHSHGLDSRYFIIHRLDERTDVRVYIDDRAAFMQAFRVPEESASLKMLVVTYGGVEFISAKEKN